MAGPPGELGDGRPQGPGRGPDPERARWRLPPCVLSSPRGPREPPQTRPCRSVSGPGGHPPGKPKEPRTGGGLSLQPRQGPRRGSMVGPAGRPHHGSESGSLMTQAMLSSRGWEPVLCARWSVEWSGARPHPVPMRRRRRSPHHCGCPLSACRRRRHHHHPRHPRRMCPQPWPRLHSQ